MKVLNHIINPIDNNKIDIKTAKGKQIIKKYSERLEILKGGSSIYNFIFDPVTNKNVLVNSGKGRSIIKKYLSQRGGSAAARRVAEVRKREAAKGRKKAQRGAVKITVAVDPGLSESNWGSGRAGSDLQRPAAAADEEWVENAERRMAKRAACKKALQDIRCGSVDTCKKSVEDGRKNNCSWLNYRDGRVSTVKTNVCKKKYKTPRKLKGRPAFAFTGAHDKELLKKKCVLGGDEKEDEGSDEEEEEEEEAGGRVIAIEDDDDEEEEEAGGRAIAIEEDDDDEEEEEEDEGGAVASKTILTVSSDEDKIIAKIFNHFREKGLIAGEDASSGLQFHQFSAILQLYFGNNERDADVIAYNLTNQARMAASTAGVTNPAAIITQDKFKEYMTSNATTGARHIDEHIRYILDITCGWTRDNGDVNAYGLHIYLFQIMNEMLINGEIGYYSWFMDTDTEDSSTKMKFEDWSDTVSDESILYKLIKKHATIARDLDRQEGAGAGAAAAANCDEIIKNYKMAIVAWFRIQVLKKLSNLPRCLVDNVSAKIVSYANRVYSLQKS